MSKRSNRREVYFSIDQICRAAGLSQFKFDELRRVRLLVPDHDGLFRSKLVSWAQKLAYLVHSGWSVEEIKNWADGRFKTTNKYKWPPDRSSW